MYLKCLSAICLLAGSLHAYSAERTSPTVVKKTVTTSKQQIKPTTKDRSLSSAEKTPQQKLAMMLDDFYTERQKCFPYC